MLELKIADLNLDADFAIAALIPINRINHLRVSLEEQICYVAELIDREQDLDHSFYEEHRDALHECRGQLIDADRLAPVENAFELSLIAEEGSCAFATAHSIRRVIATFHGRMDDPLTIVDIAHRRTGSKDGMEQLWNSASEFYAKLELFELDPPHIDTLLYSAREKIGDIRHSVQECMRWKGNT